jgi:hypothetical protein
MVDIPDRSIAMETAGGVAPAFSTEARTAVRQLGYRDCASVL